MSWEPLSEADKSVEQYVRRKGDSPMASFFCTYSGGRWCGQNFLARKEVGPRNEKDYVFLCLTPVEVEAGQ